MDTSLGHSNPDTGVKKSPFDDLNREELISKCKGFLAIAQKAKTAKTELQNEIDDYKMQLEKFDSEKKQSQENYKILQELVESLTKQKLHIITEVDTAQGKIKALNAQCKNYEQEINKYKADLIIKDQNVYDVSQKLSDLDSELISFKRQNKRLMEENEQLINQLTEIESRTAEFNDIGLKQREQLQLLEQNVLTDKEYKANIEILHSKIKELDDQLKCIEEEKSKQKSDFENKITDLKLSCETEKNKRERVNVKLRSYKDKILKCAACINQLKNSRYILTNTIKEYSENIPKWQEDIIKASKVLDDQVNALRSENSSLNVKVKVLEEELKQAIQIKKENVHSSAQIEKLSNKNVQLESQIVKLQQQISNSSSREDKVQNELDELNTKYEVLIKTELPKHITENNLLKEQINDNMLKLDQSTKKIKELSKTLKELNIEKDKLSESLQSNVQNNDFVESLTFQIKALESEKSTLVKEKLNAKDSIIDLENKNKALEEQVLNMQTEIQTMKAEIRAIEKEKSALESKNKNENEGKYNMLRCKIMELEEQYNLMKKEYDDLQDMNNLLKEEVETVKFLLEQPKDSDSDFNASLQTDIVKLENKLAAYKQENSSLLTEMKESRIKIKEYDALVSEYEDAKTKLMSYKNENSELLHEMKEINQVLKERGESISKKQKAIVEMERLIETLEKDRTHLNEENTTLHEKVDALEKQLMNAEKKTNEESGAMNKITLERDNTKKELAENESLIALLKDEIEKLKQIPATVSADLPNEDMSTSTISKAEDLSRMRDLDETFEEKYTKLRIFALKLKKKLNETTAALKNTEQDKTKLEKMLSENENKSSVLVNQATKYESKIVVNEQLEVTELKNKVKSLTETSEKISNELEKVKGELNMKNLELASEVEAHKVTKDNLEKARKDAKKKNVLSLEIEDYERSLKELTTKMEEKKKKMVQMESTIDTQEGTITAMKTQIKLLEEQIKSEETQNRLTKEELQHVIEEGKDKDSVIQAKNSIISKLEQELEDEKRKNEEADLEMTALMSDKEKIIMSLGEDKAELNNKVKKLEFKCAELNEKLKILNMELADMKTEYTSYKVRAQAVLRQNQTVDHSQEEQLKEEAAALRTQIESLTLKLSTAQEQCTEHSTEAENARRRASEASNEASRAQQRTARLHTDLTRLSQQLETERTQHKLQVSTLTQCYKTQISDLEAKLQRETELLKKQLVAAIESAKIRAAVDDSNQNPYMLPIIPKEDSDGEMDINVSMIPREEGEGSESAPSPPPSKSYMTSAGSGRSPVPLERLLEEGVPEDEAIDTSSLSLTSDQEISELKRRLTAQQQRVKHVTVLLSESERECARMAQLSELLKAELRRVRGTSHNAHNAEYMKNVTLKFLTLPPGDERGRLVPVLQKILTLTNEETQKIHSIAKGLDPNPKGWGSYLPWPGGSK